MPTSFDPIMLLSLEGSIFGKVLIFNICWLVYKLILIDLNFGILFLPHVVPNPKWAFQIYDQHTEEIGGHQLHWKGIRPVKIIPEGNTFHNSRH